MSLLRLALSLIRATFAPVRCSHRPPSGRPPAPPRPLVPRQARRRVGELSLDLIARDYPHWRLSVIPDDSRSWIVAAHGAHLIRATSAEETRRRIHAAETAPPPSPVRPYAFRRP